MKKILLLFFSLLMGLLVAEGLTRFYLYVTAEIQPLDCRQKDTILHHSYVPNSICRYKSKEWDTEIKINSLGLRNEEIKNGEQVFRILMLGDSFTAAESVTLEQTAAYLLEKRLNESGLEKEFEVINAGVPSYSPLLEYLYLREAGLKLQPDLVILNFDLGDISGENFMYRYYEAGEETLMPDFSFKESSDPGKIWAETLWQQEMTETRPMLPLVPTKIKTWMHQNFQVYDFVSGRLKKLWRKVNHIPEPPIYKINQVEDDFEYVTRSEVNANDWQVYQKPLKSLELTKQLLDKLEIPLIIIVFPHGHQVSGQEWNKGRVYYGLEKDKVYPATALDNLVQLGQDRDLAIFSVLDDFKRAKEFPLFYSFDGHFTAAGNQVMAEAIGKVLMEHWKERKKADSQKGFQAYLNIVSLVRGKQTWANQDEAWLEKQADLITSRDWSSTWLIDAQALNDEGITAYLADLGQKQELGLLLEVTSELADKFGLPYQKLISRTEPQNIFLSGYTVGQKQQILDYLFSTFKENFGFYPRSVGAWFIDSWSLNYLREKYQVEAVLLVAEQYGTDQLTARGQVWQQAYYPSKTHSLKPAAEIKEKNNLVVIQWATREPRRGFGFQAEYSNFSVQANDYSQQGLSSDYFEKLLLAYLDNPFNQFNQLTVGIEVGQEGAKFFDEFKQLLDKVKTHEKELTLATMSQFAQAYRAKFPDLSESSLVFWQEETEPNQWAIWYSSNDYRLGLIGTNDGVFIRDLRVYGPSQDDLHYLADKRRHLFRETEAVIDEVGLQKSWQIWDQPVSRLAISKDNNDVKVNFGEQTIELVDQEFRLNFKPTSKNINPNNLVETEVLGTTVYLPRETPVAKVSYRWELLIFGLLLVMLLTLAVKEKSKLTTTLSIVVSLLAVGMLSVEWLSLTPFNELGLTYFNKLNSIKAWLVYLVTPIIFIFLGIAIFSLVKRETKSWWLALVAELLFYFKSSLGWLLVIYRRLPLDPALVTGVKDNVYNFSWFFDFPSLAKLKFAYSAGQMNIDFMTKLVNKPNIFLPVAITFFLLMNWGIIFGGLVYWLIILVKKQRYWLFSGLLGLLWLTPLAVNQIDVRLPTIFDPILSILGITGSMLVIKRLAKQYRWSMVGASIIIVFSMLPGAWSLLARNKALSYRFNPMWADRGKVRWQLETADRLSDAFLWQIDKSRPKLVYWPQGIEQYFFINGQEIKKGLDLVMENSEGIIGRTKD